MILANPYRIKFIASIFIITLAFVLSCSQETESNKIKRKNDLQSSDKEHIGILASSHFNTAEEALDELNGKWLPLTKKDGEYVIFSYCRYGEGYISFDKGDMTYAISGGGNQSSQNIVDIILNDQMVTMVHTENELRGNKEYTGVDFEENKILILNKNTSIEKRFVKETEADWYSLIYEKDCED